MEEMICRKYAASRRRLFLLDYDGTLVGFQPTPAAAKPTNELRITLALLADVPSNTVVVISGRDHATLEAWLGDLPIAMVAEHGFFVKDGFNTPWKRIGHIDVGWKKVITPIMETAVAGLPNSFVEEKATALVCHYRAAAESAAELAAEQLKQQLRPYMEKLGLLLVSGNKIIEVRLSGQDKGAAAAHWLSKEAWDFILAAGDDTTDEDLFRAIPALGFTIKIESGSSAARYCLSSPAELVGLLNRLKPNKQSTN